MRFSRFHRFNGRARRVRNSSRMYNSESLVGQTVLVVGPGWLGGAVAEALTGQGALVWTLQRSVPTPPSVPGSHPITPLQGDIRLPPTQAPWVDALPASIDHVVVCIAPSRHAGDGYQATYPAAVAGSLAIAEARHSRSITYTSSTGVYGRADGAWSLETDPIVARDERQEALLEAEQILRRSETTGLGRTVLRVAGLYGPGRDPAPRFSGRMPTGASDVWCNFSWRDDVVSAISHIIRNPEPGAARVFNCADGVPLRASTIARALGAKPSAPGSAEDIAVAPGRSNQRITADALRATGWAPRMSTVLDGLEALGHVVDRAVLAAS
jgi:nucleoside-diphosphate-sugar epimerase